MIWVAIAILIAVIAGTLSINSLIRHVSGQIAGIGMMLNGIGEELREANAMLRDIANDTDKMPKADNRSIEERTYLD